MGKDGAEVMLVSGQREIAKVGLDRTILPPSVNLILLLIHLRQVDPLVHNMTQEDPGQVDYSQIGGLTEQIRELREAIELPLVNPEIFMRVGIKPPTGVLLYGPPGGCQNGWM